MPDVIFNGSEGRLEGRYTPSKRTNAPIALLLHPDPLGGGTMFNKIVHTLYQAFKKHEFTVLRFTTVARVSCPMPPRRWTGCRR
jgi:alpha/beta superfamily hydrolase